MLRFDILTIFPDVVSAVANASILKRAQQKKKIAIKVHDLRRYSLDKHRKVDDRPFGGGPGMVMSAEPFFRAVKAIKGGRKARVILMAPSGTPFSQKMAQRLSRKENLIILCGHYEGVDERVRARLADEAVSIGDYVLTGGEVPAMVVVDAIARLVPGVLGKESSLSDESFEQGLLEYPQYTRPQNFRGMKVPDVLLSGNHKGILAWRKHQSLLRTQKVRPDLWKPKNKKIDNPKRS